MHMCYIYIFKYEINIDVIVDVYWVITFLILIGIPRSSDIFFSITPNLQIACEKLLMNI